MLDTLDIKIIGVIGVLLLIVVGYFVYSLYKDLVFLKSQINSTKETGENLFKGEEPIGYDDELEDEELERHLENIMRQTQNMTHDHEDEEYHNHGDIQELEPIQEEEEPLPKKRKYKKKVTVVEPEENIIHDLS